MSARRMAPRRRIRTWRTPRWPKWRSGGREEREGVDRPPYPTKRKWLSKPTSELAGREEEARVCRLRGYGRRPGPSQDRHAVRTRRPLRRRSRWLRASRPLSRVRWMINNGGTCGGSSSTMPMLMTARTIPGSLTARPPTSRRLWNRCMRWRGCKCTRSSCC